MTNIVYTADFMAEHVLGGGELNDHELCTMIGEIEKIRCSKLNKNMLEGKLLIVSNFVTMSEDIKNHIMNNNKYVRDICYPIGFHQLNFLDNELQIQNAHQLLKYDLYLLRYFLYLLYVRMNY